MYPVEPKHMASSKIIRNDVLVLPFINIEFKRK